MSFEHVDAHLTVADGFLEVGDLAVHFTHVGVHLIPSTRGVLDDVCPPAFEVVEHGEGDRFNLPPGIVGRLNHSVSDRLCCELGSNRVRQRFIN